VRVLLLSYLSTNTNCFLPHASWGMGKKGYNLQHSSINKKTCLPAVILHRHCDPRLGRPLDVACRMTWVHVKLSMAIFSAAALPLVYHQNTNWLCSGVPTISTTIVPCISNCTCIFDFLNKLYAVSALSISNSLLFSLL